MFTGLIEDVGTIRELHQRGNYRILSISSKIAPEGVEPGDSVCCDGVCLTVVAVAGRCFSVEASQETARRAILERYAVGSPINLERALPANSRLGGHYVTGHVDDVGIVEYLRPVGESLELAVEFSSTYDRLVIEKGSIAVNGVSLTVNRVSSGRLTVNLIPFTVRNTMLGRLYPGSRVNLEFDIIGKYILNIRDGAVRKSVTKKKLVESGW